MIVTPNVKKAISAGVLLLLITFAVLNVDKKLSPLRADRRSLAVALGNGNCQYEPPNPDVDPNLNLYKYLLVGFPSGDKRMAYFQMETLTGLPSKDVWDFVFNGYTNSPFIKTNYPHPSGVWSWGSEADKVAMVVQFIRRNMVEYADVVWCQNNSPSYENERFHVERKYGERQATADWYRWRDQRVLMEIYKYGSYIDFWMENGCCRDPITHKDVSQEFWDVLTKPAPVKKIEEVHICRKTSSPTNPTIDAVVAPSEVQIYLDNGAYLGICKDAKQNIDWWNAQPKFYSESRDPHCATITNSCRPQIVISADKLRDTVAGPQETAAIAHHLQKRSSQYVVTEDTWACIWEKLVTDLGRPKSFAARQLNNEPNLSVFMLKEMLYELNRLIAKYSASAWTTSNDKAVRLVSIFQEHKALVEAEISVLNSGARTLKISDFLGPDHEYATDELVLIEAGN